jgi:hypothetical protein
LHRAYSTERIDDEAGEDFASPRRPPNRSKNAKFTLPKSEYFGSHSGILELAILKLQDARM